MCWNSMFYVVIYQLYKQYYIEMDEVIIGFLHEQWRKSVHR
jgi:hypothetical protein